MDDTLRNIAIGLGAFLAFHVVLGSRAHRSAVQQVARSFDHTGSVQVHLRPSGLFGLELNDFATVEVDGEGVRAEHLPFFVFPREGWKGSIHHLRLRLTDMLLAGLPVTRFDADLPHVSYDIGEAFNRGRLVLRGSGSGPSQVHISPSGLRAFINRKFQKTLSDVVVEIKNGKVIVHGKVQLIGPPTDFVASGLLAARAGRFVDLVDARMTLGGATVGATLAAQLLLKFNPVLDTYEDLGLAGYFEMTRVGIGVGEVVIDGEASLPIGKSVGAPGTSKP
jgi:hypothetical protein